MTEPPVPSNDNGPMKAPPATFEFLVQTMFTQALMAFGKIPNPITKESLKNLDTARHFIDMLEMLQKKTAGNLADDEKKLLEEKQIKILEEKLNQLNEGKEISVNDIDEKKFLSSLGL